MFKFNSPQINNHTLYISPKIKIIKDKNYNKIIAIANINKDEILIEEYPEINLFGEKNIDRALQIIQKYILLEECELYPRDINYIKTIMIKDIHKIIKNAEIKLRNFFNNYDKETIEFYYAKYLYNSFEGYNYGPLTLPIIAKINHSCNNNVDYNFNKKTGTMIVTSNRNIKCGEEIFDNYLSNKNISNHKEYLFNHYGFKCKC
jgi:hypothetical protein